MIYGLIAGAALIAAGIVAFFSATMSLLALLAGGLMIGIVFLVSYLGKRRSARPPAKANPAPADGQTVAVSAVPAKSRSWIWIWIIITLLVIMNVPIRNWVLSQFQSKPVPVPSGQISKEAARTSGWYLSWEKPEGYKGTSPKLRSFKHRCSVLKTDASIMIVGEIGEWQITYHGVGTINADQSVTYTGNWTQKEHGKDEGSGKFEITILKGTESGEGWFTSDDSPGPESEIHVPLRLTKE